MKRLLVLKDVAFAHDGTDAISGYNEVDTLVQGALAILNEEGTLLDLNNPGDVADSKYVTLAVGRAEDQQVIPMIPRQEVVDINVQLYRAGTKQVVTVDCSTLVDGDVGSVDLTVKDTTLSSKNFTRAMRGSYYKKAGVTASAALDALVLSINAQTPKFVTASKSTTNIVLTCDEDDITIEAVYSGLLEGASASVTTPLVHSRGKGADIVTLEKECTAQEGNGNYVNNPDLWYKRSLEAVAATNYDVITISWEGAHSSPTRSHNVFKNSVMIACPDGITGATPPASNQSVTEIVALLNNAFATAYSETEGEEPALDDGTATDGTP